MTEFLKTVWGCLDTNHELLASLAQVVGIIVGIIALVLVYRRNVSFEKQVAVGQKQAATAEKNLFYERLRHATSLLVNKHLLARVMGVDDLKALANGLHTQSDEHKLIRATLLSFVRSQKLLEVEEGAEKDADTIRQQKCTEVERAIQVLGEITPDNSRNEIYLFKQGLRGLDLSFAKLQGAILSEAKLQGAILSEAKLQGADLEEAQLQRAILSGARLQGARLPFANLQGAKLRNANLQGAILNGANLQGADLVMAEFQRIGDSPEHLIFGADFLGTEIQGANMSGANLNDTLSLTQEQLNTIIYVQGKPPNLPADLNLPEDRAYRYQGGGKFFVKSDQPWSEKNVDEWVHQELAALAKEQEE